MKSLMSLWSIAANELAARCCTSATHDITTVLGRTEHEGLSFSRLPWRTSERLPKSGLTLVSSSRPIVQHLKLLVLGVSSLRFFRVFTDVCSILVVACYWKIPTSKQSMLYVSLR